MDSNTRITTPRCLGCTLPLSAWMVDYCSPECKDYYITKEKSGVVKSNDGVTFPFANKSEMKKIIDKLKMLGETSAIIQFS